MLDKISLAFDLRVVTPGTYSIKVDGEIAKDFEILHKGIHLLEVAVELEHHKEHTISLRVDAEPDKIMAVLNNINLIWYENIAETTTSRMIKNATANEIWNYTDPKASYKALNFAANQRNRSLSLDYMLDKDHAGYINRYCKFLGDDGRVDLLNLTRRKYYSIQRSGELVFGFRSPIFYWLLERFFQEPNQT